MTKQSKQVSIPEALASHVVTLAAFLSSVACVAVKGARGAGWAAYCAMRQAGLSHDDIIAAAEAKMAIPEGVEGVTVDDLRATIGAGAARSTIANWKRAADAVLSNPTRGALVEASGEVMPITQALTYASEDAKANGKKGAAARKGGNSDKSEAGELANAEGVAFDDLTPKGKAAFLASVVRGLILTPAGLSALGEFVPDLSAMVTALSAQSVADGEEFARAAGRGLVESKARARAVAEAQEADTEAEKRAAARAALRAEAEALEARAEGAAKVETEAREALATAEAEGVGKRKLTGLRRAVQLAENARLLAATAASIKRDEVAKAA